MNTLLRALSLSIVLSCLVQAPQAFACVCVGRGALDLDAYDAVFIGTALSEVRAERGPRDRIWSTGDAVEIAFAVEASWDDSKDGIRIVRTAAGGGACGAPIQVGERHLVTASVSSSGDLAPLATGLCTHTGPINEETEKWIRGLPKPRVRFDRADSTAFGHPSVLNALRSGIPAIQLPMHRALRAAGPMARTAFEDLLAFAALDNGSTGRSSRQEAVTTLLYIDPADPRVIKLVDRLVNGREGEPRFRITELLNGIAEWQWTRSPGYPWKENYRVLRVVDISPAWQGVLPEPESFIRDSRIDPNTYLMFARHSEEQTTTLAGDPIAVERAVDLLRVGLRERLIEAWEHMYPELAPHFDPIELAGFIEDALVRPETRQLALDFAELVPEIDLQVRIEVPGAPAIEGKWRVPPEEWQ